MVHIRILVVFAQLDGTGAEIDIERLIEGLDQNAYGFEIIACAGTLGTAAHAGFETLGVKIDTAPYTLTFEQTVIHLARKIPAFDIVISCQNVADIYPALERLYWRPPLIEYGRGADEALSGPKHFTTRYVGIDCATRGAAASRMPQRDRHALLIAPLGAASAYNGETLVQWQSLFASVLCGHRPAPCANLFQSVLQGGFECSTHRRRDGRRLDIVAATRHDLHAQSDYRQLASHGMATVRDGLRWHLVEPGAETFDWSSFLPMLRAAHATGTQVIWDLMHYGWPDDIDIWRPAFVARFARFAAAVARLVRSESDAIPFYCPINEISFLAWAGGDVAYMNPFARARGFELKVQLARAAIAAMEAILAIDPRARFVHCEPVINVVPNPGYSDEGGAAATNEGQYEAWDMIGGYSWPQLGGASHLLDILGLNYYNRNQWMHGGPPIDATHRHYKPFSRLLVENHARYGRPLLVSETGTEGAGRAAWFASMAEETLRARALGIPVEGICLYPILDHPGWDDDRPCANGLLGASPVDGTRSVHHPLALSLSRFRKLRK